MKFADKYRFIRQNMKKNRTRLFMTILATAMGCCFLIVLASVGFGFQESIEREITSNGVVTEISVYPKMPKDEKVEEDLSLKDADVRYFEGLPNVNAVTRKNGVHEAILYRVGDYENSSNALFTDFPSDQKSGVKLSAGRFPQNDSEVVVGYHFADHLAKGKEGKFQGELLNQKMTVSFQKREEAPGKVPGKDAKPTELKKEVTIVGITAKPTREWLEDTTVQFSGTAYPEIYKFYWDKDFDGSYQQVKVYAKDVQDVLGISKTIKEKYNAHSVMDELQQLNTVFVMIKIGLLFIGAIAVLIAAIGIFNTMTMAVTERTQEIGIMKAIGAAPSAIRSIFLLESSYIGVIGAAIGTAVAYVISLAVNFFIPMVISSMNENSSGEPLDFTFSSIPPSLVLISVAISVGVAILSGMKPARKATEIDVLKALRRDI
ncbi:ABC transporter permease YtrF [Paenibacillus sp. J31TS4]|uniref:ABC transporter permease n=1 Tax=Paenibacillus sp. J31TS4 TaxID=2807195 RepID=UPI001B26F9A4|nr:FtsX-like permease family protein [Paenibacillus sp. J31TS4]GIP38458.1 ABC transporter permease YtrF [Paenibacillus sp. J31TS4]